MEPPGKAPDWVRGLLDEVHARSEQRLADANLLGRGLKLSRVRQWFQMNHGMTFHAYCRSLRLSYAFGRIREGEDVGPAAVGSGYDSLSGFTGSFKNTLGFSPSQSVDRQVVRVARIPSPLGPVVGGATADGICLLGFADRRMLETQLARLRTHFDAEIVPGRCDLLSRLVEQLGEYFDGERRAFDVPLVMPGTPFQQHVWEGLRTPSHSARRDRTKSRLRRSGVRRRSVRSLVPTVTTGSRSSSPVTA